MAEIIQTAAPSTSRSRRQNATARPDMTPMVDLAFLLVTFFVLTTSMMKPKAMEIIYPKEEGEPLKANHVVSVLLDESSNRVFWYYGEFKGRDTEMHETDFSSNGIRKVLFQYNSSVQKRIAALQQQFPQEQVWTQKEMQEYKKLSNEIYSANHALTVVIKTLPATKFSQVISAMDELNISHVRKRAVQDMNKDEEDFIKSL